MCWVLQVASSGWYRLCQRCDTAVRAQFFTAKQRYGALRLTDELYDGGIKYNRASLRDQSLQVKATQKFRPVSYRNHGLPVSENVLKQDFYAPGPNQK